MRPPTPDHAAAAQSYSQGQYDRAASHAQTALRATPADPFMHMVLAMSLERLGREDEALPHAEQAVKILPNDPRMHGTLGLVLSKLRRFDEALAALDRALALDPADAQALNRKADVLLALGRGDEAADMLRPVIEPDNPPRPGPLLAFARIARTDTDRGLAQQKLEALLETPKLAPVTRTGVRYRLAALYDKAGRYDEAYTLVTRETPPVPLSVVHDVHALRARWTRESIARLPVSGEADETPVLVVGMPRSGTTLTEQIIAAHPRAAGAGEVTTLLRLAHQIEQSPRLPTGEQLGAWRTSYIQQLRRYSGASDDTTRIVDKLPLNALAIGVAARALPGVRVVYCVRDPRDVCLSCLMRNFDNRNRYTLDPVLCAREYNAVHRAMAHWRDVTDLPIHVVRHEELVADPEPHIRELIAFLGLEWDDRCLRPHEADTTVQTASSGQVRSPINAKGVGHWRHYADRLAPMATELTRLGLLDAEGAFTP